MLANKLTRNNTTTSNTSNATITVGNSVGFWGWNDTIFGSIVPYPFYHNNREVSFVSSTNGTIIRVILKETGLGTIPNDDTAWESVRIFGNSVDITVFRNNHGFILNTAGVQHLWDVPGNVTLVDGLQYSVAFT